MISHLCHLLTVHARQICISNTQDLISTTQTLILRSPSTTKMFRVNFVVEKLLG